MPLHYIDWNLFQSRDIDMGQYDQELHIIQHTRHARSQILWCEEWRRIGLGIETPKKKIEEKEPTKLADVVDLYIGYKLSNRG